jgi:protein involved in polysaccharide export with SLBB domain
MRNRALALWLLLAAAGSLPADSGITDIKKLRGTSNEVLKTFQVEIANKAAFVLLNQDYPVTPGDSYALRYQFNLKQSILPFFIESDYTADLSFFGRINTRGMDFARLKQRLLSMVNAAYPDSLPSVSIESVGAFPVLVTGEVKAPGLAQAWGFTRLSDVLAERLTAYSSIRDVQIVSADGRSGIHDLYQAALASDLTRNPVVRPGDKVLIRRLEREIFVQGEVFRAGAYQLLPGENLVQAIQTYAGGLTNFASPRQAYILRLQGGEGRTDTVYVDLSQAPYPDLQLKDVDLIVVPSITEQLPLVFFEGALFMKPTEQAPTSARLPWVITGDQRISTALRSLPEGAITPASDLQAAFILRAKDGRQQPVDLFRIYYEHDLAGDVSLQEGDRIVIPPKFYTVFVGGAVLEPGALPFIPGKGVLDYLQLAGGFDPDLSNGRRVRVVDREGNRFGTDRIIQPEDKIYVPKNSFEYIFNKRVYPIVTTTAAIVALVFTFDNIYEAVLSLFGR